MEVDHVLPEWLQEAPAKLTAVLASYGLPATFDLQSFSNWLPSCRPCNNKKRARIFEPVPAILLELDTAVRHAPRAAELAKESVSRQAASRSWNTILRAAESGVLPDDIQAAIHEFARQLQEAREPEAARQPLQLTPLLSVIHEDGRIRMLRGPYGIGIAPSNLETAHSSWRCPGCGNAAWNGVRCVACGHMDDGD